MILKNALLLLALIAAPAGAVSLGEAVAADQMVRQVDGMAPADRAAFIEAHRSELNHALLIQQITLATARAVEASSIASEHLYGFPLICGDAPRAESDDDDFAAPPPIAIDLPAMAASFKSDLKKRLHLPDNTATEQRLNQVDIADVIADRMIEGKKCDNQNVKVK